MTPAMTAISEFHRAGGRHDWTVDQTAPIPVHPHSVALPAPDWPDAKLTDCIAARVSCRNFATDAPLDLAALSMLLAFGYGIRGHVRTMDHDLAERPVPSASALYALSVLVFVRNVAGLHPAIYRYDPTRHSLTACAALPTDPALAQIYLQQDYVAQAAAILTLTAQPDAVAERYTERAYRFLLMEAGHVVQNIALGAAATDLGCCPIGGFEDYRVAMAANIDPALEWPLYAAAIGPKAIPENGDIRDPLIPK
ncbi:MAG: SagB/ThcOx family dehydrogenase [Sulfitobacter sp.]